MYDYIIIGGGIAGLYANYLLSSKYNGILLEKNKHFGGRAYEIDFHKTLIKLGAGIMDENNINLLRLLKKLNIKVNSFKSTIDTSMELFEMGDAIWEIKYKYNKYKNIIKNKKYTMKQFLIKYFGPTFTKKFILNCEYYDFINSDVEYFIKYYDIDDMSHDPYNLLIINWTDLTKKLLKNNCYNNCDVLQVKKRDNIFNVITKNNIYECKKIIFAISLKPLIKLSKNILKIDYKKYIGSVPFVRIYCYYKNGYSSDLSHFTIVENKLQKIIKINNNILMASYSDSSNALYWNKISKLTKDKQIKIVNKFLNEYNITGTINDIIIAFWDEGVHYYKPTQHLHKTINKLSKPDKNIYIIGEMVSYKQGWVEGSIESVNRIIKKMI